MEMLEKMIEELKSGKADTVITLEDSIENVEKFAEENGLYIAERNDGIVTLKKIEE